MPLPAGPGIGISLDYSRPLPVIPRGSTSILLLPDRFRRRADMFAITVGEFSAQGTADVLILRSSLGMPAQHPFRQQQ